MHRLFRYTAISALLLAVSLTVNAQKFDEAWKTVYSYIEKKNQVKALDALKYIQDQAQKDADGHEMLRCAITANRLNATNQKNARYSAQSYLKFDSLRTILDDDGLKAICHYLQAICIDEYAKAYNFRIPSGSELNLDINQIKDTLLHHFEQAFLLAENKRTVDYVDFISGYGGSNITLHPYLKDVLLESSCISLTNDNWSKWEHDSRSYNHSGISDLLRSDLRIVSNASQFLEAVSHVDNQNPQLWPLYILKLLTERNIDARTDIRASIDFMRVRTIMQYANGFDRVTVSECIEQVADSYLDKSKFSAGLYYLAADALADRLGYDETIDKESKGRMSTHAHELLLKAISIWPDNEIAHHCRKLINTLQKRDLEITFDRYIRAGQPNIGIMNFCNVDTVYFKVVHYDRNTPYTGTYDLYRKLSTFKEAARWSVTTGQRSDFTKHAMWISLPALAKGEYMVLASTDKDFADEQCYSYRQITSSGIVFTPTFVNEDENAVTLTGFIFDAATGRKPVKCSYTLIDQYDDEISKGQTSKDGFLSMTYTQISPRDYHRKYYHDILLILDHDGESDTITIGNIGSGYYRNNDFANVPIKIHFYTDRNKYRPGDTVHYCGIVSLIPADLKGRVLSNTPVAVYSSTDRDELRICIQETFTDSHGKFTGQFVIPENSKTEELLFEAVVLPDDIIPEKIIDSDHPFRHTPGDSKRIEIESYRRNLLDLTFDEMPAPPVPGAETECSGKVLTPLGNPVSGAKIEWTTSVTLRDERSLEIHFRDIILETGQTETASDGSFTIRFKAHTDPDQMLTLTAKVTDCNGETHEFDKGIYMKNMISLELSTEKAISSPDDILLQTHVNSEYPASGQYRIRIEALYHGENKGINIYEAFKVKESDRKEMSEYALSDGTLTATYPNYDFNCSSNTPRVAYTLMDSTFEFSAGQRQDIKVPGIKTGLYRVTLSSDDATIRYFDQYYYNNKNSITKDMFISVGNAEEALDTDNLLTLTAKRTILGIKDKATFRIGSPYPGTVIRYDIINRNGSLRHGTMIADGSLHNISLPISEELYGNIMIVATAYKDGLKARACEIQYIPYLNKTLDYEISTFRSNLTAGADETWTFRFKDKKGKPVQASVMVDMYDSTIDDDYSRNRWDFFPWQFANFRTDDPVRLTEMHYSRYSLKYTPAYSGPKTMDYTISNPLLSPILGQPIPLREMSSSVSSVYSNDFLPINYNNGKLETTDNPLQATEPTEIRKNLSQTGLFLTDLTTDSKGYVTVKFKAPELLTRWRLQVFAYTDHLQTNGFAGYVTTAKHLMVEPAAPRFFRQGDVTDFVQKITNLLPEDVDVTLHIRFTDAVSGSPLDLTAGDSVRSLSVKAGGSASVPFTLTIPEGVNGITYTVIASSSQYSDGQQETIPVLSDRVQVTKTLSLYNNGNETRHFTSNAPAISASGSASDEVLTLQYHSEPIWYAIEALSSLKNSNTPDNISLLSNFAAVSMAYMILESFPELENRLTAMIPNLNESLLYIEDLLEQIESRQNSDGGWPWLPGGDSNPYITSFILYVYDFLDMNFYSDYNKGLDYLAGIKRKEYPFHNIDQSDIMFLYLYSKKGQHFKTAPEAEETFNLMLREVEKSYHNEKDLYHRALLIQLLINTGKTDMAHNLADMILESSSYSDEMGRWWKENKTDSRCKQSPIETQAALVRALRANGFDREAEEAARWLLKQKQTTAWESDIATIAAIMALIETRSGAIHGTPAEVTVKVGNETIKPQTSDKEAGYMTRIWNGPVSPDKARITVTGKSDGISWGTLYHTFTQQLDHVEDNGSGMQLQRTLWHVVRNAQGEHLEEITPATILHQGDRIRVTLKFTLDRTFDFLQIKSSRASSLEPVSTQAGHRHNDTDRFDYYMAPANTSDDIYMEHLEEGTYMIGYDLFVQKSGRYRIGTATIQSLYAPSFRAITTSPVINVE